MRSRYRCSMCPAIHINSRSWLRSSSTHEPSDPPLRVVISLSCSIIRRSASSTRATVPVDVATTQTARCRRTVCLGCVLVIHRGLSRTVVVYMGDRYGDSLNLAITELYPVDASRQGKVPVTSARRENKKSTFGRPQPRFIKPETQGTQTRTPIRSSRQTASSEY